MEAGRSPPSTHRRCPPLPSAPCAKSYSLENGTCAKVPTLIKSSFTPAERERERERDKERQRESPPAPRAQPAVYLGWEKARSSTEEDHGVPSKITKLCFDLRDRQHAKETSLAITMGTPRVGPPKGREPMRATARLRATQIQANLSFLAMISMSTDVNHISTQLTL